MQYLYAIDASVVLQILLRFLGRNIVADVIVSLGKPRFDKNRGFLVVATVLFGLRIVVGSCFYRT